MLYKFSNISIFSIIRSPWRWHCKAEIYRRVEAIVLSQIYLNVCIIRLSYDGPHNKHALLHLNNFIKDVNHSDRFWPTVIITNFLIQE